MKRIIKALRLLGFILLLILASMGMGFALNIFGSKEKYANKPIRVELVDKKEEEGEEKKKN